MYGKLLVWDAACPDTFVPSYSPSASRRLELLQLWLKRESRQSIPTSLPATCLHQRLLKLQELSVLRLQIFCKSWEDTSGWPLERKRPSLLVSAFFCDNPKGKCSHSYGFLFPSMQIWKTFALLFSICLKCFC